MSIHYDGYEIRHLGLTDMFGERDVFLSIFNPLYFIDKRDYAFRCDSLMMDDVVDVRGCCHRAEELFELYQRMEPPKNSGSDSP